MRASRAALLTLLVSALSACSESAEDCAATNSCSPFDAGNGDGSGGSAASGGSSASGGSGGSSASGGSGGSSATGGTAGSGGSGGSGGAAGADAGCDPTLSPSEDLCVVDNAFGIFVSPIGDDLNGEGTKEKPFKTFVTALPHAISQPNKRLYACDDGTGFTEPLNLDASHNGLELYGGLSCADWSYSTAAKTRIASPDPVAARISGVTSKLVVDGFDVIAADATAAGASSFAMIIANSTGVVLRRTRLEAGNGADGAPGENGVQGANGAPLGDAQKGKDANCTAGAPGTQSGGSWQDPSACGSLGGTGGSAHKSAVQAGGDGLSGEPLTNVDPPGVNNGGSGATVEGQNGRPGEPGSNGLSGAVGLAAATRGLFTATGYTPANGNPGTNGFPGQGGGGGGASKGTATCVGASGGAGGMGGCGGGRGSGGGGGGASVALLSWLSSVTLDNAQLVAGNGGSGAKGGDSAMGGDVGVGAAGGSGNGNGGRGGDGGRGGPGGSGAGGSGGPSYALVYGGLEPDHAGTVTRAFGSGGAKGIGGALQGFGTNNAPDGSVGLAGEIFEQF